MPPTTVDPNRTCWNCKHFAPADRQTSQDGECRFTPPRYNGLLAPFFFFPAALGVEWCGNWERNAATVGDMPVQGLREGEETELPTLENTMREIHLFAEENEIEIVGNPNKDELLAEVLEKWEANQ